MINNSIQRFLEIIILNHWFDKKLCLPLWLEISPINLFNFCEHKSFYSKMVASKVLLAFLCCAIAVATATNTTIDADEYVMQRPAILGMFRFVVSLRINNQHICSGSVLNRNWILTAARCLHGQQPAQVEAFIAGQRLTTGLRYVLTRFVIHPQYNSRSTKNDIALARTRLAIPSLGNSWNIRLPTSTQLPSSALEAGYGFARVSCWKFPFQISRSSDLIYFFADTRWHPNQIENLWSIVYSIYHFNHESAMPCGSEKFGTILTSDIAMHRLTNAILHMCIWYRQPSDWTGPNLRRSIMDCWLHNTTPECLYRCAAT